MGAVRPVLHALALPRGVRRCVTTARRLEWNCPAPSCPDHRCPLCSASMSSPSRCRCDPSAAVQGVDMDLQRLRFVRRHYRTRTKAARAAAPMKTSPVRSGRGGAPIRRHSGRQPQSTAGVPCAQRPLRCRPRPCARHCEADSYDRLRSVEWFQATGLSGAMNAYGCSGALCILARGLARRRCTAAERAGGRVRDRRRVAVGRVGGEHRRACERRFRRYPDLTAALSLVCPLSGTQRYSAVLSGTQRYSAVLSGTAPTCRCVGALRIRARVCKWGTERMGRTTKYSTSTAQC